MIKWKLYGIAAIIILMVVSAVIGVIRADAKKELEIKNLKAAAEIYASDSKLKSKLNIELVEEKRILTIKGLRLKNELRELKTTPQQAKCNITTLPSGYFDRVLKH